MAPALVANAHHDTSACTLDTRTHWHGVKRYYYAGTYYGSTTRVYWNVYLYGIGPFLEQVYDECSRIR